MDEGDSRDIPEGLSELKGFVDDTLALFVVTEFGVALFKVSPHEDAVERARDVQ
jgi:hypothetical protein